MDKVALTLCGLLIGLTVLSANQARGASIKVAAFPPTVRIAQEGPIEGVPTAQMAGARGGTESCQVVVTAEGGRLEGVTVSFQALREAGGRSLPEDCVELFRVAYVPVRYSAPRATCAPGLIPDPLIPFRNPYTGEPVREPRWTDERGSRPRFGAAGFDLWAGHHQPLWVDVRIPQDATPGEYEGVLRVVARNAGATEIPIRLTVWDFTLPEGPTHENHFGGFDSLRSYHHLENDVEKYNRLEERYIAMLAAHRLNPPIPARFWPKPAPDGTVSFDAEADRHLTEFVNRYHVTNIPVPRAPFGDVLGKHRAEAIQFYRTLFAYLETKGWARRAYLYMLDEPNDADAYERVRQLGALVRQAAPGLRRLVVEQPYTQNPEWGVLDGAVDIWCPLFAFIDEPSVERVLAQGNTVWSYSALVQAAPSYHPHFAEVKDQDPPYWQLDFPVTSYRVAPWLNRRYRITGLLYWSTVYWGSPKRNPWDDPGFRFRYNGDGALFYPGEDAGIEGPIGSIRLKCLRDGMEDYEYLALLEQVGGKTVVEEVVRAAVPTWGTWVQDPNCLPALRARVAKEIVGRKR